MPEALSGFDLTLTEDGRKLVYTYLTTAKRTGITKLLSTLAAEGISFSDLDTNQSSLEDIFVSLVEDAA